MVNKVRELFKAEFPELTPHIVRWYPISKTEIRLVHEYGWEYTFIILGKTEWRLTKTK